MKQISTILSVLSFVGVLILSVLFFKGKSDSGAGIKTADSAGATDFKIAYFDIDTLQAYYKDFQDAENVLRSEEGSSRNELNSLGTYYQKRLRELQDKAPSMSQAEGEAAQRELAKLQQGYQQKELELDQRLKKSQVDQMTRLHADVEAYLKKFNESKGYAYIFSYQQGALMYFKDTAYDITQEMIKGLNEQYSSKKK
jgi:outer membrane protein